MYTTKECKLVIEHLDEIIKNADNLSATIIKPTHNDLKILFSIVLNFVIEKKRKIYGGFALNKLLESVEKKDMIYDINDITKWDIDFYSPTPIEDAREISLRIFDKGYRHILAREAQHDETYTIFAETKNIADITYVPKNIYNKMPFVVIDNIHITGPHFMLIDYFRVITDPLTSYYRLDKTFNRLCLIAKHFPLPEYDTTITISPLSNELDVAFSIVHDFIINKPSLVVIGMYAFNHLIKEIKTDIKNVDINYYEVISTNYKIDTKNMILELQKRINIYGKTSITYKENYPFFQYLGYNVDIYYDNIIICRMYHYNIKCIPYNTVPAIYFNNNLQITKAGTIQIGSYAILMLYNLINVMWAKTTNDSNTEELYYNLLSHMVQYKTYYFKHTDKTILDESLFQEFILRCVGETVSPQMEKALRIELKMKLGKKYSWCFNPEKDAKVVTKYVFKNSSGGPINNVKNNKIDLLSVSTTGSIIEFDDE